MRDQWMLGALVSGAIAMLFASGPSVRAQEETAIRIGAVLATTGPAAELGVAAKKTLEIFVDAINEDGGLIGRPLELIAYDSRGDANEARALATRLVEEDGIVAMIGGSTTGETLAMMPIFDDHEIPFISLAGALAIVEPVRPFVFKTPHTDKMACEKIVADIAARGLAGIALVSSTDEFGKSMRAACLGVARSNGVSIVADETFDPAAADLSAEVGRIADAGRADVVVVAGAGEGAARAAKAAAERMPGAPVYVGHGVASPALIEWAGAAAEGVRLPSSAILVADLLPKTDPQRDVLMTYKSRYEEVTGEPVSAHGGHAFDGLMLLAEAIRRAGSVDPFDLRNALESTSGFIGTAGVVNMTSIDHMGLDETAFRMLEVREGAFRLVED